LSIPAHAAARVVEVLDVDLAHVLAEIRHASATVVFLAFSEASLGVTVRGSGYLVPERLGRPAAAVTCVTNKWPERAPTDVVLLRVFLRAPVADDAEAIAIARRELHDTLGVRAPPMLTHVARFVDATPIPEIGHPSRVARIREHVAAVPGLHLAGNGYDGFGLSDCVRQGEAIARRISERRAV
jgi:oxygen-dependent protoporphyrinogen oxidase